MYLSVVLIAVILIVLASPALWVAWWLLADVGERAGGRYSDHHHRAGHSRFRPA